QTDIGPVATALLTRRIGLFSTGDVPAVISNALSRLATQVGAAGGAIILPTTASLLQDDLFWSAVSSVPQAGPTLGYGQVCAENGLHIMDTATVDWAETLVGLGATGVDIVIAYVAQQPLSGHPLIPLVQISSTPGPAALHGADEEVSLNVDVDLLLHDTDNEDEIVSRLGDVLRAVLAGEEETVAVRNGDLAFQLSRGSLGISL
ncbi:MAG: UxaA family hydrolase, partial [Caldilineaceae bacterium]|nr:UxaA family hydrolase [Caldilineaceae bacterium]